MLKQIKWRSILVGIGYILAGLLLIVYPESSRDLIAYVLGIALVVYGIVSLTTYFVINVKKVFVVMNSRLVSWQYSPVLSLSLNNKSY